MEMTFVTSDNVRAVGYDAGTQVLRISFKSGGTYEYYGVPANLYESMLLPHPWHRVGQSIRSHRYRRIAA